MRWCGLVAGGMMQYLPMITPGICLGRIAEQQPTICPEYPSVSQYSTAQYSTLQYSTEQVVQQYTEAVGRYYIPPYWALGFHLCRCDDDR